jgi:hypothetical protein
MAEMFIEQMWQIPARFLIEHGIPENDAIQVGERLVGTGLITQDAARAYVAEHPEHKPIV